MDAGEARHFLQLKKEGHAEENESSLEPTRRLFAAAALRPQKSKTTSERAHNLHSNEHEIEVDWWVFSLKASFLLAKAEGQ